MKKICTLSILSALLIFSCQEDDNQLGVPPDERFELNLDFSSSTASQFIIVSDNEGEIVFDTMASSFIGMKKLPVLNDEELHVTHGFESETYFTIRTFTNVRSGFLFKGTGSPCDNELLNSDYPNKEIELVINDVPLVDSIYYPFFKSFGTPPEIDMDNNRIIIKGRIPEGQNQLITLKVSSSLESYKSYLVSFEDLTINDNEAYGEVNFNDFENSVIHDISLIESDENWSIDVEGLTNDNQSIQLSRWSNSGDNQNGIARVFSLEGLNIEQYLVNIRSLYSYDHYKYKKIGSSIPNEILLHEPQVQVLENTENSYHVLFDDSPDLILARYQYNIDNSLYHWNIYSNNDDELDILLPEIPSYLLLDNSLISDELISNPSHFTIESFTIDDFSELNFFEKNIDLELRCSQYTSRTIDE